MVNEIPKDRGVTMNLREIADQIGIGKYPEAMDAVYGDMTDIDQVPIDIIHRLIHYFSTYKDIPGEHTSRMQFISIYGPEVAKEVIKRSMEDYDDLIAPKLG